MSRNALFHLKKGDLIEIKKNIRTVKSSTTNEIVYEIDIVKICKDKIWIDGEYYCWVRHNKILKIDLYAEGNFFITPKLDSKWRW